MIQIEQSPAGMPRVLVVEDTAIVANEIARMLRDLGCVVIGPVGTLRGAELAAQSEDIDVALLDVNLQNEPVFPAAEILIDRHVPIAFLTGYARSSLPARFSALPCLEKPFSTDDLVHVLEQTLGHAVRH